MKCVSKTNTLFFILLALFGFNIIVSASNLQNYFPVSEDVENQTEIMSNVGVFYNYTDPFYELPDEEPSDDIFQELNIWDPLEGGNRVVFAFNYLTAKWLLLPISQVYSYIIPEYARNGIQRIDSNIQMPGRLINSILQARFKSSGIELARFGINTTVGILGFYDPAYNWYELEPLDNNFGLTFGYWGIPKGFYLVLPIQGSTCIRNGVGLVGDYFANPITWIPPYTFWNWISWGIKLGLGFNNMSLNLKDALRMGQSSLDPYEASKTVWYIVQSIQEARLKTVDQ